MIFGTMDAQVCMVDPFIQIDDFGNEFDVLEFPAESREYDIMHASILYFMTGHHSYGEPICGYWPSAFDPVDFTG